MFDDFDAQITCEEYYNDHDRYEYEVLREMWEQEEIDYVNMLLREAAEIDREENS